jgi:HTH-type transcriptional regulator/antitoxin MqsA
MMNEATECPLCGGSVQHVHGKVVARVGARRVEVESDFRRCNSCGETFHDPVKAQALQRAAADTIRQAEGLLTPDEIKQIRKGLKLSQSNMEKLLGVGKKTVVRWERGTVFQSAAIDKLLRLIAASGEAAYRLGQLSGVDIAAPTTEATLIAYHVSNFVGLPSGIGSPTRFAQARSYGSTSDSLNFDPASLGVYGRTLH